MRYLHANARKPVRYHRARPGFPFVFEEPAMKPFIPGDTLVVRTECNPVREDLPRGVRYYCNTCGWFGKPTDEHEADRALMSHLFPLRK